MAMTPLTNTNTLSGSTPAVGPRSRLTAEHSVLALAVAVAALGLLDLWSALLARGPGRAEFLHDVIHLPLMVAHGSRTLIALFGLGLLMLARSLARRKQQAWRITVLLVSASPFLHLTKGLDWEEALVCLILLAALLQFRHSFWAENDRPSARQGLLAAAGLISFAALYGPLGYTLLRREYSPPPTPALILEQTTYRLAFAPDHPILKAHTHRARWFDGSLRVIALFAAGYALWMLLRPVLDRSRIEEEARDAARRLLQTAGGAPLAYFTLLPDKRYLFDAEGAQPRWAVAYVPVGRQAIALGDPLGAPEDAPQAIQTFVSLCRRHDWQPAFYQTTAQHLSAYRQSGLKALKVGEDAVIDLSTFTLSGKRFQDLRTALNKMGKLGVRCVECSPDALDADALAQMAEISEQWLRQHKGEEKTFALGRFAPDSQCFQDSRVFLARNADNLILAFVTFVPIFGDAPGWGLDLMRRRASVPNGTMEFLIASCLQTFQTEGAQRVSLGLSPLAGTAEHSDPHEDEWLARSRSVLFQRFNHFYSFKGLHGFKEKFGPQWEPRYLLYDGANALAPTLYAVIKAHSPRGLWTFWAKK
ncbi:MAG: phosphatidylglycerol lysyltransferase domain-containing protein [Armatimonadota bacterium]|nr:phosphatidylglycerol lysyltransferase domain-containing protein [Armatimonadota bacterium]